MDLPAKKRGRFYKALIGFAISNLSLRILFGSFFYWQKVNSLFVYSLISICFWTLVILLSLQNHTKAAFIIGLLDVCAFSFFSSLIVGWQGGFYLQILEGIPLSFYNTEIKKRTRFILGSLLIILIFYMFGLFNGNFIPDQSSLVITEICFVINLLGVCVTLALVGFLYEVSFSAVENEALLTHQKMLVMANTDPLTDLINRRIMMTKIESEKARVDKGEKPFSLIMIDVDNFKQINDEFGHDGGDFVLINLARLINICLRKTDVVSRWGGDEFLILLPETATQNGQIVADKIKRLINNSPFVYHEKDIPVTVTLGVAQCDHFTGIGGSIRKADLALYDGKHSGKNKVVVTE